MIGLGYNYVFGYIYNKDNSYHTPPIKISIEPDDIANFIMKSSESPQVIITNSDDLEEITVAYGYVLTCKDQQFLEEKLLPILIPMQEGKKLVGTFKALSYGVDKFEFSDEHMVEWIKKKFDVSL